MQLAIPRLGTKIQLTSEWKFDLYFEQRNEKLIKHFNPDISNDLMEESWYKIPLDCMEAVLPKKLILIVDRIYIRKGNKDFDSVSFKIPKDTILPKNIRFWAKLTDVNKINCKLIDW